MVESTSGGTGNIMSGNESITNSATPTSVSSSIPGSQLVTTTGEDEGGSAVTSATGNI